MDRLEDYHEGKGCTCYAKCESECGCGADWTDKEVYKLQEQLKQKDKRIAELVDELNWHKPPSED